MAKPARRSPQRPSVTTAERLAVVETRLEETLERFDEALERWGESQRLMTAALEGALSRIAFLESSKMEQSGAAAVRASNRTEAQEWARTMTPVILTFIATAGAVIWKALGGT